jgi:PAS domain S-box-containing protein
MSRNDRSGGGGVPGDTGSPGPDQPSSVALLGAIVESTDDAIVSTDPGGVISSWNRAAEGLFGYAAEEAIGSPIAMLYPSTGDPELSLRKIIAGQPTSYSEGERVRRDGTTVLVGETLTPITSVDGQSIGMAAISRNVTARRETEQALETAQRELEARNRRLERSNSDLEQFAYVASHDLSEPLRAVAGMVGLLRRRYEGRLDSDADEFITFAVEGCERMRAMIEDLLAYSRAGRVELRLSDVDVADSVAAVVRSLGPQIDDAGATVVWSDLPVVRADGSQLTQVFQNLISNAVKFRRPDQPARVEISASHESNRWRFDVADNGIGIEEPYRERVFRMFQRLHAVEDYPGTGIGLAISERIVDRHGGGITVRSSPLGGSTFTFTIADDLEDSP